MNYEVVKENEISFIKVTNDKDLVVTLCSFGASFYSILYKNKNMILAPSKKSDFYTKKTYHGKIVGRFSGRIADAKCEIDGITYTLDKNWNGVNSLHGGYEGLSFQNFEYEIIELKNFINVEFRYLEKEKDLPGDVDYCIVYRIHRNTNKVDLVMNAISTKKTIVNITNHAFFNLNNNESTILNEELKLNCSRYGDLDNNLICKKIKKVNKIMDFTKRHKIKDYINSSYLINHTAFGYDHFWVKTDETNPKIAELFDNQSNVKLTVSTSYPAIVCYSNNYPTDMTFIPDCKDKKYQSICLECQYVPNGINMKNVNQGLLNAGEKYKNYISYEFTDVKKV